MYGMKRTIIFLLFALVSPFAFAKANPSAARNGFPVYPVSAVKEYADNDSGHFTVAMASFAEIESARKYFDEHVAEYGWKLFARDTQTSVYVRADGAKTDTVKVLFHRPGTLLQGSSEPLAQGGIEYFFSGANTGYEFQVTKIVTMLREEAVEAYMKVLAKKPFVDIAKVYSSGADIQETISADPMNESVTAREVKRLATGQYSDIFVREDGKFCIVKLDRVTRGGVEVPYGGENVVLRNEDLAQVLQKLSDAAGAMQEVSKVVAADPSTKSK